ncbi:MAG: amidohydrolase [Culicoidibacterales bacterium]
MKDFEVSETNIIQWRRHLHQNPELSHHEYNSAQYIFTILTSFSNLTLTRPTPTSVVALLQGQNPGPLIALRADIDALPLLEEADVSFKSLNNGVMHACGHDAHPAMLLGAIEVLSQMPHRLHGSVKFIFQHAEEVSPGGAKQLVDAGVLVGVSHIFGFHVSPNRPTGHIGLTIGAANAACDDFVLTIQGRGAHGATPQVAIDPILIGANIITSLNHIVSRNISAFDQVVISVGEFKSGNASNIIPDTAFMQGTVRTTSKEARAHTRIRIETIIDHLCTMSGATYTLDYLFGTDIVFNDPLATNIAKQAATKIVGADAIYDSPQSMGAEDFSAYTELETIKGSFIRLGTGLAADGYGYSAHHPKFKIDEAALKIGAEVEVQIVLDMLSK